MIPPESKSTENSDFLKNIFREFGGRLKFIREKLGLSQSEFASKLGFASYNVISRFERGERLPSAEVLINLAKFSNCNLHWLLTGTPSPDGEVWRTSYAELLRMYHSDVLPWIERLESEIADLKKQRTQLQEQESLGGTINPLKLDLIDEKIRFRENVLAKIKDHLKQAFDRCGGVSMDL